MSVSKSPLVTRQGERVGYLGQNSCLHGLFRFRFQCVLFSTLHKSILMQFFFSLTLLLPPIPPSHVFSFSEDISDLLYRSGGEKHASFLQRTRILFRLCLAFFLA